MMVVLCEGVKYGMLLYVSVTILGMLNYMGVLQ